MEKIGHIMEKLWNQTREKATQILQTVDIHNHPHAGRTKQEVLLADPMRNRNHREDTELEAQGKEEPGFFMPSALPLLEPNQKPIK